MFNLKYAEFYITNVCNLNCINCNRLNNFAFSGHERWEDFQPLYKEWSEKITFDMLGILGGEPLLNPTFLDWVNGVLELWPTTKLNIITNGTQLSRWPELYQILKNNKDRVRLKITIHGKTLKNKTIDTIENFLVGPITKTYNDDIFPNHAWKDMWEIIRGDDWPDCPTANDFYLLPKDIQQECEENHDLGPQLWVDSNGVGVEVTLVNFFVTGPMIINNQELSLHNSDPDKAVETCMSKFCHHFSRGKLYKCGLMGILPDFIDQFYVDINNADRQLLNSYQAATPKWSDHEFEEFLTGLKNGTAIPQCKFCPAEYVSTRFDADTKKVKFQKRINNKI